MPGIDYYKITNRISEILAAHPDLFNTTVRTEGEADFTSGLEPWVGVYFERRDPSPNQNLDAGQSTRYLLRYSIWCWCMSIDNIYDAIKRRDDLVNIVERVLMRYRTLDDGTGPLVDMSWLMGGNMPSGRFDSGNDGTSITYLSGGEILLLAEASTTTT
jgi:hypothetical protein